MNGEFWHVADDGTHTDVTEAVQVMYDALHSSMDFGSGMLDTEEVQAMRRMGNLAGFEPIVYDLDACTCGHDRKDHKWSDRGGNACAHGWYISGYVGRDHTGRIVATVGYRHELTRHAGLTIEPIVKEPGCPCEAFTLGDGA